MSSARIAVVGAGAWGTALAVVLAGNGHQVDLWVFEDDLCRDLQTRRENRRFLPGIALPAAVHPTSALEPMLTAVEHDAVVLAMPSHVLRPLAGRLARALPGGRDYPMVIATKGLEENTLLRMSEVTREVLGPAWPGHLATLSGPTFAREIAAGDPAAVVVASAHAPTAAVVQRFFSGPTLRLYTSADVVGVELGGALKNVIAIAAGICQGLGLGSNTQAALIARGLAEITRLASAAGGRAETIAGLAGLGDLVLTCTGALSRNRALGLALAQGQALPAILATRDTVAEGVKTTAAGRELARRYRVEMPILEQMHRVLFEALPPRDAIATLMRRALKAEA